MTKNDRKLVAQMIKAGRYSWGLYQIMIEQNALDSKALIKQMGSKWLCHRDNYVKRLEVPLPLLSQPKTLKKQ